MIRQTRETDLQLFAELAGVERFRVAAGGALLDPAAGLRHLAS